MDLKVSALLFFCLLNIGVSQKYFPWTLGRCLNPSTVQSFNATQFFSNRWYLLESYGNFLYQGAGICPTLVSRITNNGLILIKTYNFNPRRRLYRSFDGTSYVSDLRNGQGYLTVRFSALGFLSVEIPIYIIGTDYNDWAVVYSCRPRTFFSKSEMAFVLVRDRGSNGNTTALNERILSAGLDVNNFVRSINTGCGPNEPTV